MAPTLLNSRLARALFCAAMACGTAALPPLRAQTMTLDETYHPQFRARANVRIFPQSDGNLAATGAAYLGDDRAPSVFRFAPDGTILDDDGPRAVVTRPWMDIVFPDGRRVTATIHTTSIGWDTTGYYALVATRSPAGEVLNELRLDLEGYREGTTVLLLEPALKLVALPDGRVLAGGLAGFVRINTDGTRDTTFSVSSSVVQGALRDMIALADGSVVAALGGTLRVGAVPLLVEGPATLHRIRPDGTRDEAYSAILDEPALHVALPDGRILTGSTSLRRLSAAGTVDPTFDASSGAPAQILAVRRLTDGRLLVAGGTARRSPTVVLLDADGALLSDFVGLFPDSQAVVLDGVDTSGHAWVRHGYGGAVYRDWVEGMTAAVTWPENARVRLPVGGTPEVMPFAFSRTPLVDGAVQTLHSDGSGRIIVGGNFHTIDGVPHHRIARLLRDGTIDHGYAPPAGLGRGVWPARAHPDGRVLVQGTGSGSAPYMRRLLPDGTVDATLAADCALATTPQLTVFAVDRDGGYLVRRTQAYGETPAFVEVQRYAENGSLTWATRNPAGLPVIHASALAADGRIIVHGAAQSGYPNTTADSRLFALRADGTLDDTYRPIMPDGYSVLSIELMPDGTALVTFQNLNHGLRYRTHTVRVRTDGSRDPDFYLPEFETDVQGSMFFHPTHDGGFLGRSPYEPEIVDDVQPLRRWLRDGALVPEFSATLPHESYTTLLLTSDDVLYTAGPFTLGDSISAAISAPLVRHLPSRTPGIVLQPPDAIAVAGAEVVLTVAVGDAGPATYQWQRDGIDLAGETGSRLILAPASTADSGTYRCVIRIGATTHVTGGSVVTIAPNTTKLINFSARSRIAPGQTQIGGIVVDDAAGQSALLRAIGTALPWDLGVPLLPDPLLTLYERETPIAQDRGGLWAPEIQALGDRLGAFRPRWPWPDNVRAIATNSALARTLAPGTYTAHTTAYDGQPGVSLFEYYDADPAGPGPGVRNLSIRAVTGPGADVLIPGFVVRGTGKIRLLIRAIGPSLARFGVSEPVADPRLIVRAFGTNGPDATNDNWAGDPAIVAAAASVSAFALDPASKDAALVVTLPAGAYTVQIPAAGDQRGEVLAEIYVLEP